MNSPGESQQFNIPVGQLSHTQVVEMTTFLVTLLGTAILVITMVTHEVAKRRADRWWWEPKTKRN